MFFCEAIAVQIAVARDADVDAPSRAFFRYRLSALGVSQSPEAVPLLVLIGDHAAPPPTVGEVFDALRVRAYHPLLVLTMQVGGETMSTAVEEKARSTIVRVRATHDVDPARIYLVGEARGADLVWRLIEFSGDDYAAAVAANMRAGGAADPSRLDRLAGVPFWIFHDAADERVPVAVVRATVGALWAAGANVRYTEYRDDDPGRWAALRREDRLLTWLFMQSRE